MTEPTVAASPQITAYVDALMAYNRLIWTNSLSAPTGSTQEATNRENYKTLERLVEAYTGGVIDSLPTPVPSELQTLLNAIGISDNTTTENNEQLDALNAVLRARNTVRVALNAIIDHQPTRDAISGSVTRELRTRLLNETSGDPTPQGTTGQWNGTIDKEFAIGLANFAYATTAPEMTRDAAAVILSRYVRAIAGESPVGGQPTPSQVALIAALGVTDISALQTYDLTVAANFNKALAAFQNSRQPRIPAGATPGELTPATIDALGAMRTDATLEARAFINGASNLASDTWSFLRGLPARASAAVNGATNGTSPSQPAAGSNDFFQGIQQWFGEMWDNIANMFSGEGGEGVNFGSIAGGGVFGAILYFIAGAFGPIGQFAQWPLAILGFFMGANVGKDWGRDGDDSSAPSTPRGPRTRDIPAGDAERIAAAFAPQQTRTAALARIDGVDAARMGNTATAGQEVRVAATDLEVPAAPFTPPVEERVVTV